MPQRHNPPLRYGTSEFKLSNVPGGRSSATPVKLFSLGIGFIKRKPFFLVDWLSWYKLHEWRLCLKSSKARKRAWNGQGKLESEN